MDLNDIKQAIISAPNMTRSLKEIILNRNIFSNYHISLYRKGVYIEQTNDSIFYNYSNISRIYCLHKDGIKALCIDYSNQKIELTSCLYSGNGTNEETNKSRMLDSLQTLITIYWKTYNTK